MSKKQFTDEQVLAFRGNPCVKSVSNLSVSFTEGFKRVAREELTAGEQMWQIFKKYGVDTDALGPARIMKFRQRITSSRGESPPNARYAGDDAKTDLNERFESLEDEITRLRHMVESLTEVKADRGY